MSLCRVYPVFVGKDRVEVRVHGLLAMTPATQAAVRELVEAIAKLKRLDLGCEIVDPTVERNCEAPK